ncbi:hypothetical protein [Achromobacter xylosoxidans]|nr:hypothetical protein [Achromobacter xylosoxidans]
MTKSQQVAYEKAMEEARKLAKLKRRSAMAPHVHKWAEAMKALLSGN